MKKKIAAGILAFSVATTGVVAPQQAHADQIEVSEINGVGDALKAIGPIGVVGAFSSGSSYIGSSATPWALFVNPIWWLGALLIGLSRGNLSPALEFGSSVPRTKAFDLESLLPSLINLAKAYVKIPE
ncbi:MAG: hypothetical protein Q3972_06170 [Corynebacterium sp.]|nr:hypothetical protein [Corynebacterium sp.]